MVYWGDILSIPSAKLSNASRQCDIALVEEMKGRCIFYKFYLLVYFENYPTSNF